MQAHVLMLQVYVSVYADGPTRVLRFADAKSTALLEAEQSILDLAARLKQVRLSTPLEQSLQCFRGMTICGLYMGIASTTVHMD